MVLVLLFRFLPQSWLCAIYRTARSLAEREYRSLRIMGDGTVARVARAVLQYGSVHFDSGIAEEDLALVDAHRIDNDVALLNFVAEEACVLPNDPALRACLLSRTSAVIHATDADVLALIDECLGDDDVWLCDMDGPSLLDLAVRCRLVQMDSDKLSVLTGRTDEYVQQALEWCD
jgi:hypothetical protein